MIPPLPHYSSHSSLLWDDMHNAPPWASDKPVVFSFLGMYVQWSVSGGQFPPRGHLALFGDIFGLGSVLLSPTIIQLFFITAYKHLHYPKIQGSSIVPWTFSPSPQNLLPHRPLQGLALVTHLLLILSWRGLLGIFCSPLKSLGDFALFLPFTHH